MERRASMLLAAMLAILGPAGCASTPASCCLPGCSAPVNVVVPCSPCAPSGPAQAAAAPSPPPPPPAARDVELRRRASFELDCPEGSLEIVPLDASTSGVRGCGRRATYVLECGRTDGVERCDWKPATPSAP